VSNVFRYTPTTYFQTPEVVIESGVWARLIPSARSLYTLILYLAQRNSRPVVSVTASDAAKVGLSVNSVKAARECLVRHKLIAATRTSDGYSYEILDASTGNGLEPIEDLSKVDEVVVREYFLHKLSGYDPDELHHGLRLRCPFHPSTKQRQKPFHVTFLDGGGFKCHDCDHKGGIIDFEIAMASKGGEHLSRNKAFGQVRQALLSAGRRYEKCREEEMKQARAMV
jgi:hypothetical protein